MWAIKHEPQRIDDIILDDNIKQKLCGFVRNKYVPNIIITGCQGIGKTTITKCIVKELYGDINNDLVCNVNSIVDDNIKNISEILNFFCRKKVENANKQKIVITNDIDNMPIKIQNTIASCMEKYKQIGFIFTCNNLRINEILQSRCIIIYIQRPTDEKIVEHLKQICHSEKYSFDDDGIRKICFISQCDVRYAINLLQIICESFKHISIENINKINDMPDTVVISSILDACVKKNTVSAFKIINQLDIDGYACSDVLCGMFDVIKAVDSKIPENIKINFLNVISKSRYNVSKKLDSKLQLEKCVIKLCSIIV